MRFKIQTPALAIMWYHQLTQITFITSSETRGKIAPIPDYFLNLELCVLIAPKQIVLGNWPNADVLLCNASIDL